MQYGLQERSVEGPGLYSQSKQISIREKIENQILQTTTKLAELKDLYSLFEKNPEFERMLDLVLKVNVF